MGEEGKTGSWWSRQGRLSKVLIVVVALIVLLDISGSLGGTEESVETTTTEASVHAIGDTVQVGDVAWKALETSRSDGRVRAGDEFYEDTYAPQGRYVWVRTRVENIGNKTKIVSSRSVTLVDRWSPAHPEIREFDAFTRPGMSRYVEDKKISFERINPGLAIEGTLVFEVPVDARDFFLKIRDGGEEAMIKLGI